MAIEKETTTFSFTFKANDITFNFNIAAENREEALKIMRTSLAAIIVDINEELKS